MTTSQTISDSLCTKLRAVGLRKPEALKLVNKIQIWVKCEGPEHTVKRLKDFKQQFLNHLAGKPVQFTWIANRNGVPKGAFKPFWERATQSDASYRAKARLLNILMVYADIALSKRASPTKLQADKFEGSVVRESQLTPQWIKDRVQTQVLRYTYDTSRLYDRLVSEMVDFDTYAVQKYGTDQRRLQHAKGMLDDVSYGKLKEFLCFPLVRRIIGESRMEVIHYTTAFGTPWSKKPEKIWVNPNPIGVIGSTQEPGMKFRAFASPNLVLQGALEPMKGALLNLLKGLDNDFTHDQDKGVQRTQQWLADGRTVHSVDLSDATNNFPLDLQLAVMDLFFPVADVNLFHMVARSPYTKLWDGQDITWTQGQPLGSGPSFPLFAFTHNMLVRAIERHHGVKPLGSSFSILGDDIVIADDRVHTTYREIMALLSVPISESKCMSSNRVAEFAGQVILPDHILKGYKYSEISDLSFMNVLRAVGPRGLSRTILTERQLEYARLLAPLPEPVGLGWNPKGIPLAERYRVVHYYLEAREREQKRPEMVSNSRLSNYFHFATDRLESGDFALPAYRSDYVERIVPMRVESGDPRKSDLTMSTSRLRQKLDEIEHTGRCYDDLLSAVSSSSGDDSEKYLAMRDSLRSKSFTSEGPSL